MRWTQQPHLASPPAIDTARELEQRFYTQAEPRDLTDREGVIVVDARTGSAAPARYHRRGAPDIHGYRPPDVFEAFPESPWARSLPYADTMMDGRQGPQSRLGIFRLNHNSHVHDVAALYNGRAMQHRDESLIPKLPASWMKSLHKGEGREGARACGRWQVRHGRQGNVSDMYRAQLRTLRDEERNNDV
jgi:hypothetical protein